MKSNTFIVGIKKQKAKYAIKRQCLFLMITLNERNATNLKRLLPAAHIAKSTDI